MRLKRQRHGRLALIYVLVCAAAAAAADLGEGEHPGVTCGGVPAARAPLPAVWQPTQSSAERQILLHVTKPWPRRRPRAAATAVQTLLHFASVHRAGPILLKLQDASEAAVPGSWDAGLASAECEAAAGGDWAAGTPPCGDGATDRWRGVTCSTQGAVTEM